MFTVEYAVINSVITILSAFIVYYLFEKKAEKTINFYKNQLKNEAETWLNSESGQKAIYSIGAIIGNGAKAGIGIKTSGGKFKFENLIAEIAGRFIQDRISPNIPQESQVLNNKTPDKISFGSA